MSLNARVAESRAIEDFVDAATMPAGDEVALTARVAQGAAILVAYRHGLARKTAQVVPLWSTDPSAEPLVLGFAYARNSAPLAVEDAAGGMVRVLGLAEAPGTLSSEVRDTLRAAGLPVVKELLAVRPHLEGREAVLAAPVRSPWRAVLFWLSAVLLVGSYVLNAEIYRIRAERRRIALARASAERSAPPAAAARFMPLAEDDDAAGGTRDGEDGKTGWLSRARQIISRPA